MDFTAWQRVSLPNFLKVLMAWQKLAAIKLYTISTKSQAEWFQMLCCASQVVPTKKPNVVPVIA